MTLGALAMVAGAVLRRRRLKAAWSGGIAVQGRCLRTYVTTTVWRRGHHESASSSLSHVYEFTDQDGRTRRFEEDGRGTVFEGDAVVVRYPPGRPDRATALEPDDPRARAKTRLQMGFGVFATLLCVAATAVFLTATSVFQSAKDEVDDFRKRPPAEQRQEPRQPSATGWPAELPAPPVTLPTDLPVPPGPPMPSDPPMPPGFPAKHP
ncbi:DUF3592 domain-containing protein [Streptomyces cinnamoneus]|nr:DUF3592 domain-containing protein [Streptomyces cinnamoneus]